MQFKDCAFQNSAGFFVRLGQFDRADDLFVGDRECALLSIDGRRLLILDADHIAFRRAGFFQDVVAVQQIVEHGLAVFAGHVRAQRDCAGLVVQSEGRAS